MRDKLGRFVKGYCSSPATQFKKGIRSNPNGEFKKGYKSWNKNKKTGFIPKSAFKKGHIPWHKGKKMSEEHRKILSLAHKGKFKGVKNPCWRGGKTIHQGYIRIYLPNHPFARNGYIFEHRLIVEKQIGRYLKPKECCHHFGKRNDNRPKMLMTFVSTPAHRRFHYNPNKVKLSEIIFDGRNL